MILRTECWQPWECYVAHKRPLTYLNSSWVLDTCSLHNVPHPSLSPREGSPGFGLSLWGETKFHSNFFSPKPQSFPSHAHVSSYVSVVPVNHLLLVSLQLYLNILTFVILPPLKFSSSKTTFACVNCIFSNTQESNYIVIGWKWNLHLSHLKWSCLPFESQGAL